MLPEVVAMQAGPIVVDGTMYFTTERGSYSIDAATCAEKWRVERQSSRPSPLGVQRGFAYLDGRLFRGTSDAHVLALDAADGHTLWDVTMDVAETPGLSMPMAPIAANGLVFIGNAGGDQTGVTGHVYALDARDGHVVWRFDVVPEDPAVRATWPNADRYPITGGAFWTSFALDAERGVLYVPAGNPAPDFDVEARGGDNLYTNSLIALDAATGRIARLQPARQTRRARLGRERPAGAWRHARGGRRSSRPRTRTGSCPCSTAARSLRAAAGRRGSRRALADDLSIGRRRRARTSTCRCRAPSACASAPAFRAATSGTAPRSIRR